MSKNQIIITAAIALVLGGAGFYGGTAYEKNSLSSQGLLRSGSAQFGGRQSRVAGARNGGGFMAGQIISKDDTSITIKGPDGGTKIVFFSGSTTIGKSTQGSSSDLSTGEEVMVNGKANSDGSIAAQNIQIRPAQKAQSSSN